MSIFKTNCWSWRLFNLGIDMLSEIRDKDLEAFNRESRGASFLIEGDYYLSFTLTIQSHQEDDGEVRYVLKMCPSSGYLSFPELKGEYYLYYKIKDAECNLYKDDNLRDCVDALLEIFKNKNEGLEDYLSLIKGVRSGDLNRVLRNAHLRFNRFLGGEPSRFDYREDRKYIDMCLDKVREIRSIEKKVEDLEIEMGKTLWYRGDSGKSSGDYLLFHR